MKAKDLIALLKSVPEDSDIVTPGFDESYAPSEFTLIPVVIKFNVQSATTHFAPHDYDEVHETEDKPNGYLLDGTW